jgi:hypothetical protein
MTEDKAKERAKNLVTFWLREDSRAPTLQVLTYKNSSVRKDLEDRITSEILLAYEEGLIAEPPQ